MDNATTPVGISFLSSLQGFENEWLFMCASYIRNQNEKNFNYVPVYWIDMSMAAHSHRRIRWFGCLMDSDANADMIRNTFEDMLPIWSPTPEIII